MRNTIKTLRQHGTGFSIEAAPWSCENFKTLAGLTIGVMW